MAEPLPEKLYHPSAKHVELEHLPFEEQHNQLVSHFSLPFLSSGQQAKLEEQILEATEKEHRKFGEQVNDRLRVNNAIFLVGKVPALFNMHFREHTREQGPYQILKLTLDLHDIVSHRDSTPATKQFLIAEAKTHFDKVRRIVQHTLDEFKP